MTDPDLMNRSDEDLLLLARQGDREAEDCLYERFKPMVRGKSRSYFLVGADREDVMQEGMIGLYKALRDFDPEKGQTLHSFADLCVTRQILSAVKTAGRKKHQPLNGYISLTRSPTNQDDDDRTIAEMLSLARISDPEEQLISREDMDVIEECVRTDLSSLERETLTLYLAGLSYAQIASALSRTEKTVDNAMQRIKRKLNKKMRAYSILK